MPTIEIDKKKCRKDGICAAECPLSLITVPDRKTFPVETENAADLCIRCGHCVAVCPHGALALAGMNPADCPPADEALRPGPEQAAYFLRSRRSVRVYKEKALSRKAVAGLIDIARYAPSGHNNQLTEWLVIYDRADVRQYAALVIDWMKDALTTSPELAASYHFDLLVQAWGEGRDRICRSAPHLVIAHGPAQNMVLPTTCTIALTYLELAAAAQGLGACWAGYFYRAAVSWPPLKQALGLPEGNGVFGAMMIGYPKYKYHRLPLRNEAKVIWK